MKQLCVALTLMLVCISGAWAGEIFGSIKQGGKPVPKGTKVEVVTPQKVFSGAADAYGSYRFYIPDKGKFTMKVYLDKQSPSMDIVSYEKSTRYDLSVEGTSGHYTLKRK